MTKTHLLNHLNQLHDQLYEIMQEKDTTSRAVKCLKAGSMITQLIGRINETEEAIA